MAKWTHIAATAAVLGLFGLAGCGSDVAVAGQQVNDDASGGGSDILLSDSGSDDAGNPSDTWGIDGIWEHDTGTLDGVSYPDIWVQDIGPIGCKADSNCPSSPCAKGVCDQTSHVCVFYTAPDGTACGPQPTGCIGPGSCQNGQCIAPSVPCDDGNPCTQDLCDATGGCIFTAIPGCGGPGCKTNTDCNDGNACTQDMCSGGQCAYAFIGCATSDPCTSAYCDPQSGGCMYTKIPNCGQTGCQVDAQCNDGNSCTTDYCKGGTCLNIAIPNCGQTGCSSDAQCDDGIKCSIDKCQFDPTGMGTCTHSGDLSQKGICCDPFMNSITCYDGNPCTADSCGMNFQCQYLPMPGCGGPGCKTNTDCNDNNACTQDMCAGGQCAYSGIACGSSDPCMLASCDPATGMCISTPIPGCGQTGCTSDAQCDDGNLCTVDACALSSAGGTCVHKADLTMPGVCCDPTSSMPSTCNDNNACTQDICGPDSMCQFLQMPGCTVKCTADKDCTAGDVCTLAKCDVPSGVCLYGTIPNCCNPAYCDDGNPCTTDGCDASTGGCTWTPIPGCTKPCDPTMCNDGNPCTTDLCDPSGNCQNIPMPNCAVQFCKMDTDCIDSDPCTKDYCDTTTYTCAHISAPGCGVAPCKTNAECNDFNNCTGDLCLNNQCAHKTVTCDDGNPCTADQCNAANGSCSNAPIPGCTATACKADSMCNDGNPCTLDACLTGWCNYTPIPNCFLPP